jgi:rhodanese-related sulfurtransferase
MTLTVQQMLTAAEAVVPRISADEAKGLVGRTDVVFLDVREPGEVAASGKVPGESLERFHRHG